MIRRLKIFRFNYQLMRLFGNSKGVSLVKAYRMCQGEKVRCHPGRRRDDSV